VIVVSADEREFWETYALHYEALYELEPVQQMFRDLVALGRLGLGRQILDVGCGTGFLLRSLSGSSLPDVVGIDASTAMLERARLVGYAGRFDTAVADLTEPLEHWGLEPRQRFDRIVLNNVLYTAPSPTLLLRKLARLAADNAVLVASTPRSNADMYAILREHLTAYLGRGGTDPAAERARIMSLLAPVIGLNQRILGSEHYHFPARDQLVGWFSRTGWVLTEPPVTTYAGQNWLVRARKGKA
jgi:SAM-dependent methyltransferase